MIIQADVKGLEVVVAAFLSQDEVLYDELNSGIDIHTNNQHLFNLPDRDIAKTLKFRLLYGGNEYSFANDPDFTGVSSSPNYWKKIIDKYYEKYYGIKHWHSDIIKKVSETGELEMFTGRKFKWDLNKNGEFKIPVTQIKNWPVQGTGADIVSIARASLIKRWRENEHNIRGSLVSTVHDSIICDVDSRSCDKAYSLLSSVFSDLPSNINRVFNCGWDLETKVEILVGKNMYELEEVC